MRRIVASLVLFVVTPKPAAAEEPSTDWRIDLPIAVGAGGIALAFLKFPVETTHRWDREAFGNWDRTVRDQFSRRAAAVSDLTLVATLASPFFGEAGRSIDDGITDRALVYGEALGISLALNTVTKYLVQRPRPYLYHRDPRVSAWGARQGKDGMLSFYSAHAALAFTAATTGGYLLASRTENAGARAAMWASGSALAATTAMLRVRAGKHYYSDVLVGAVLGVGVGIAVPASHGAAFSMTTTDAAAIGGGLALGVLASQILPLGDRELALAPLVVQSGGGVALSGRVR